MSSNCPNCRMCAYFHVTWDNAAPLGCKKFGFKTRNMPSLEVLATTGQQCCFFEPKPSPGQAQASSVPPEALPDNSSFTILG